MKYMILKKGNDIPYLENVKLNKYVYGFLNNKNNKYTGSAIVTIHYKNKIIHNDMDLPAIEIKYMTNTCIRIWVKHGLAHRDTLNDKGKILPAFVLFNNKSNTYSNPLYFINNQLEFLH